MVSAWVTSPRTGLTGKGQTPLAEAQNRLVAQHGQHATDWLAGDSSTKPSLVLPEIDMQN
jgi:hypothetical protein